MSDSYPIEDRNRVRRIPSRGQYDKATVFQIVDDALIGHVAMNLDGDPVVIPMLLARDNEEILLHGATTSRLLEHVAQGHPISIGVTHVDGLVLARSIFHHSVNYRSALLFGRGHLLAEEGKLEALERFSEKLIPGRWQEARKPTLPELKATSIVAVEIESASAKIRTGPPGDDPEDLTYPVWAGVLPMVTNAVSPEPAPELHPSYPLPDYVKRWLVTRGGCHAD